MDIRAAVIDNDYTVGIQLNESLEPHGRLRSSDRVRQICINHIFRDRNSRLIRAYPFVEQGLDQPGFSNSG